MSLTRKVMPSGIIEEAKFINNDDVDYGRRQHLSGLIEEGNLTNYGVWYGMKRWSDGRLEEGCFEQNNNNRLERGKKVWPNNGRVEIGEYNKDGIMIQGKIIHENGYIQVVK